MNKTLNLTSQLICDIAGISESEYTSKVFSQGYMYLDVCFKATEEQKKKLSTNSFFWKWWCRQWQLREEALIGRYMITRAMGVQINLYHEWSKAHSPANYLNIYPNRWTVASILHVINHYESRKPSSATQA